MSVPRIGHECRIRQAIPTSRTATSGPYPWNGSKLSLSESMTTCQADGLETHLGRVQDHDGQSWFGKGCLRRSPRTCTNSSQRTSGPQHRMAGSFALDLDGDCDGDGDGDGEGGSCQTAASGTSGQPAVLVMASQGNAQGVNWFLRFRFSVDGARPLQPTSFIVDGLLACKLS